MRTAQRSRMETGRFLGCSLEEDSLFRTAQFLKAFNELDDAHHIMEGNLFNSKSTDFNIYLLKVPQFKCQPHLKISSQQYPDWCMTKQLAPWPTQVDLNHPRDNKEHLIHQAVVLREIMPITA